MKWMDIKKCVLREPKNPLGICLVGEKKKECKIKFSNLEEKQQWVKAFTDITKSVEPENN